MTYRCSHKKLETDLQVEGRRRVKGRANNCLAKILHNDMAELGLSNLLVFDKATQKEMIM